MFFYRYTNVYVGTPDVDEGFNISKPTTPHECRLRDLTYSAPITVDIEYTKGSERVFKSGLLIGRLVFRFRTTQLLLQKTILLECP